MLSIFMRNLQPSHFHSAQRPIVARAKNAPNKQTQPFNGGMIKYWSVPMSQNVLVVHKILLTRVHNYHHHHHDQGHDHHHHYDQGSDRGSKVQLHWILNLFSIVAAAGGFGAIYLNKEVIIITIIIHVIIILNMIISIRTCIFSHVVQKV